MQANWNPTRLAAFVSTAIVPAVLVALASPDWGWVLMRLLAQTVGGGPRASAPHGEIRL